VHPLDLDQAGRRFVALGSVIAMEPPILLLDEPQRGLDRAAVMRLESIIADHVHAGGAALIVCHDMEFVARRASRVLAVAGGRIVADRSTLDFFAAPEHAQAAGVEPPDTIALARLLALAPSLTPAAFAAAWLAAWR
jgi:energy-coupling factor transport system ATP-binding protein